MYERAALTHTFDNYWYGKSRELGGPSFGSGAAGRVKEFRGEGSLYWRAYLVLRSMRPWYRVVLSGSRLCLTSLGPIHCVATLWGEAVRHLGVASRGYRGGYTLATFPFSAGLLRDVLLQEDLQQDKVC